MKKTIYLYSCTVLVSFVLFGCSPESKTTAEDNQPKADSVSNKSVEGSVPIDEIASNPSRDVFFGETHIHSAYSLDAYLGGTRLTHEGAYQYAKGEKVSMMGRQLQRRRPLDFVAISDHAEFMGEMYSTLVEGAPGYNHKLLIELRALTDDEEREKWFFKYVISANRGVVPKHPEFFAGEVTIKSAWQLMSESADRHNEPGKFTALKAFEWSAAPQGGNLHRNVIFRGADVPELPVSYVDINREEGLWDWMKKQESEGKKLLAIPHNSNASKGMMFADVQSDGSPIDIEYAQMRQHFEPLIEIMQLKGNSEVHRRFWLEDEFADFENADSIEKSSERTFKKGFFVREGLKMGLVEKQRLGVNPFKYGIIGGSDNHNGLPGDVAEDTFIGGHGPVDGSVMARRTGSVTGWIDGKDLSLGSLSGVWATQNTRSAIWDAMKRGETYATSGPRIKVRFFGGSNLEVAPTDYQSFVEQGYKLGVPMGGDLALSSNSPPTFTVHASKDVDGANLDRVQIIKGWVDEKGGMHEKIINVTWSDDRKIDKNGKLQRVGNTVDLKTAKYTNSIGEAILMGSWTDNEFKVNQHAFYYVRVFEIPTPRWSTYDAVRNNLPLLTDVQSTIQERAWTSPIWYNPSN